MRITETEIKEIIKLLERLGYSMGVETVFRDWCECFALALCGNPEPQTDDMATMIEENPWLE